MSASDREAVNPSHAKQPDPRTHVRQSPQHLAAPKTDQGIGRAPVKQSPQVKRTNT
jgi:hypothetical protein